MAAGKETRPWVNTEGSQSPQAPLPFPRARRVELGPGGKQPGPVHIPQAVLPSRGPAAEGQAGGCVDAAEEKVMTCRLV